LLVYRPHLLRGGGGVIKQPPCSDESRNVQRENQDDEKNKEEQNKGRILTSQQILKTTIASSASSSPASSSSFTSVHLEPFPDVEEKFRNPHVEVMVSKVIQILNLGRQLRDKLRIKVKTPLNEMIIVGEDERINHNFKPYEETIMSELNLKRIRYDRHIRRYIYYTAKPNKKILQKKIGKKKWKAAEFFIVGLNSDRVMTLKKQGWLHMKELDETITLSDVHISTHVRKAEDEPPSASDPMGPELGYEVGHDGNITICLDRRLTPNLRMEGVLREFTNSVNKARKTMGMMKGAPAKVFFYCDSDSLSQKILASMTKLCHLTGCITFVEDPNLGRQNSSNSISLAETQPIEYKIMESPLHDIKTEYGSIRFHVIDVDTTTKAPTPMIPPIQSSSFPPPQLKLQNQYRSVNSDSKKNKAKMLPTEREQYETQLKSKCKIDDVKIANCTDGSNNAFGTANTGLMENDNHLLLEKVKILLDEDGYLKNASIVNGLTKEGADRLKLRLNMLRRQDGPALRQVQNHVYTHQDARDKRLAAQNIANSTSDNKTDDNTGTINDEEYKRKYQDVLEPWREDGFEQDEREILGDEIQRLTPLERFLQRQDVTYTAARLVDMLHRSKYFEEYNRQFATPEGLRRGQYGYSEDEDQMRLFEDTPPQ